MNSTPASDQHNSPSERQEYLDERKLLVEGEKSTSASFDRYILTLSGGALALTMVFIRDIAPNPLASSRLYLFTSWIAFGAAIIMMLASMLTSQSAFRKQRDIIGMSHGSQVQDDPRNQWAWATNILNILSMVAFGVGVVFIAIFIAFNLFPKD